MNISNARIGFCCKWLDSPEEAAGRKPNSASRHMNGRSTTMRWLREHRDDAEQRQWEIMNHNAAAALALVEHVGSLAPHLRMVRIGSEMLQGYTEKDWQTWWQRPEIQDHCAQIFAPIGEAARRLGVRLSFHPGQFCVLASESDDIVERSIDEFEYHTDMARWMGYGSSWHDHGFKINVHLSGKGGPDKFLRSLGRLSPEARNLIAIENDEITHGLDSVLLVAHSVPITLDIHHHWVKTGEYISPNDARAQRVLDSWRGVRPVLHYSVSREDILVDHDPRDRPNLELLLARGFTRSKLRAHSDFYWNSAVNEYALTFADQWDIQCEAKGKNIARDQVAALFNAVVG